MLESDEEVVAAVTAAAASEQPIWNTMVVEDDVDEAAEDNGSPAFTTAELFAKLPDARARGGRCRSGVDNLLILQRELVLRNLENVEKMNLDSFFAAGPRM